MTAARGSAWASGSAAANWLQAGTNVWGHSQAQYRSPPVAPPEDTWQLFIYWFVVINPQHFVPELLVKNMQTTRSQMAACIHAHIFGSEPLVNKSPTTRSQMAAWHTCSHFCFRTFSKQHFNHQGPNGCTHTCPQYVAQHCFNSTYKHSIVALVFIWYDLVPKVPNPM